MNPSPAFAPPSAVSEIGQIAITVMPDHDLWMSFVRDPDGNLVGLMSEVGKQPAGVCP